MKNSKRILVLVIVLVYAVSMCFAQAQKETSEKWILKATMSQSEVADSAEGVYLKYLQEKLAERTNGAIRVDIYPSEQLGSQSEMVQGVQANTIDIAVLNYTVLANYYPDASLPTCPGLFQDEAEANAVMNGDWGKKFNADIEAKTGVKVISTISNGFRCFTSNKPISTIASAKGQTLRCMTNPISVEMVNAVGANAVPMASGEMYAAMQNGTIDGQENPIINIINDKTYEVQKYMTLDNHMCSLCAFIMSSQTYNNFDEATKKIVNQTIAEAADEAAKVFDRLNKEGLVKLRNLGMTVYEPTAAELAEWQAPIQKACGAYIKNTVDSALVDSLQKAIADYRK